jgi:N-acetylglutamate synthase-like GNAT family acetyltransferase
MLEIKKLYQEDAVAVREFVVGITNGEFGLGFQKHEQPDLYNLEQFYDNGGFWVARFNGRIAGTIGLQKISRDAIAMRHLFVVPEHRGQDSKIAYHLYRRFMMYAKISDYKKVFVWAPDIAVAAQAFLRRNGFIQLTDERLLPDCFTFPERESKIFVSEILI